MQSVRTVDDALAVPPARDRTLAATMHVATIFAPIIAPVVALAIGRKSPFLTAHGMRSLKETLLLQFAFFTAAIISVSYTIMSLWGHYQTDWKDFSFWPMLARFAIGWLLLGLLELVNIVCAVRMAIRAYRGEWPKVRFAGKPNSRPPSSVPPRREDRP